MIITIIVCEVNEMEMTQIQACNMSACAYNMNDVCHTLGIGFVFGNLDEEFHSCGPRT